MSGAHRAEKAPRRGRPLSGLLVAAAVLLGATGGLGTFAYWNDVETVEGGVVTAGSLKLSVKDSDGVEVGPWSKLTLANLAPGESVAASLTVRNVGTTPFTVGVAGSGTGDLLPGVDVALAPGVAPTTGSTSYPRKQTCGVASDLALKDGPSWALSGAISPGGSLQVCVRLSLRPTAANELQGKSITPTFTFTATQVAP
ncbi:putative ribosomally synthesized peptide with SipW-like signal peptide [Nocardioides marinisabuli]|uniref:Putative ribosomally synthesized peptide with SipW-like signal peptide n=1 Tax=Nocardioides marinisabuli TaxID=419476 RepID=A0A7Y9F132_9ACTN|nr:TasA family protein [Nocardioides marinisabuli]NYD56825.1 putative ribosomally synthesized peptide with SipW-like signal peptide [Nocardioides marinisabuli]